LEYGEVSDVAPDVRLTLQNAGHILGSSLVHLHIGEGMHNIVWAIDMKYARTTLFEPAFTNFSRVETLILESTYGGADNIMPHRKETEHQLMSVINKTMQRGGTVVIPTFSVERSQDVMAILVQNDFEHPVFIDGMIWDATGIFTAYPEYMSSNIQRKIFNNQDPFTNEIFRRIASQADREKAWEVKPSVILTTSGMLVGGPVMEHLRALAEDSKNTLIFVGYQADGTMGSRIQNGWRELPIKSENGKSSSIKMNMDVETVEGLSGHSDRNQLLNFISRLNSKPHRVIIGHGEQSRSLDLARSIYKLFRIETVAPKNLEAIRLR
jgi:predicted metal-dependent RNase